MKRGAAGGDDNKLPSRAGKRPKKPRGKGSNSESMKVKSGDFELDLSRFPDKLRWLLDNEVAPQALWWLSGGDAIGINKNAFEAQLLEQEFRGNKFSSITRKLNRWGFRRIDDEERVPKGSIAYSHDFFVQSAIARMRFMKKEEDRKPSAEGEDAKAGEETKAESLRSLLGDPEPQRPEIGNVASPEGLVRSPVTQSSLDMVTRVLNAPGAQPSTNLGQHQQPTYLTNQVESQVTNSLLALANSQLPNFTATAPPAELSSLRNQLTGSLHHQQLLMQERQRQQQLLLQERQQQLLLEERQQQLQRLSAASIGPNQFEQAQGYLGGAHRSIFDSVRLSLPAGLHSASLGVHADPSLIAAAALYPTASDLAMSRMFGAGGAGYVDNFTSLRAAGFQPPEVASLNPNPDPDMSRLLVLQRQQNQQVGQERLLQLQQQLNAGQQRPAAFRLRPEEGDDARTETKEAYEDGGRR